MMPIPLYLLDALVHQLPTGAALVAHELLCGALFWSVFCRGAKADGDTRLVVRLALFLLGAVAIISAAAPLYGWRPDVITLLMLASYTLMQITAAVLWHDGVPHQFCNPTTREGC